MSPRHFSSRFLKLSVAGVKLQLSFVSTDDGKLHPKGQIGEDWALFVGFDHGGRMVVAIGFCGCRILWGWREEAAANLRDGEAAATAFCPC
ncbi:hypothetical protein R6Q59_026553 [Mikania micrantha]